MIELRKGDIILCQSNHWFGAVLLSVLNFFQKDPVNYSHTSMATGKDTIIQARFKIEEITFNPNLLKKYKILRMKSLTELQTDQMVQASRQFINCPYGVKRLLAHLFDELFQTHYFTHKIRQRDNQVCSSFTAWVLQNEIGYKTNGLDWTEVDPDDFEDDSLKNPDLWEIIDTK